MIRAILAAAALALFAAPAPAEERFVTAIPTDFYYAWRSPDPRVDFREYVPEGETYERWSQMLTRQVFSGPPKKSPKELLATLYEMQKRNCGQVRGGVVGEGRESGFETLYALLTCDRSQRFGLPEATFYKIVAGREALYLLLWALRPPHFPTENRDAFNAISRRATGFLGAAFVCSEGKLDDTECPPGVGTRMPVQDHACAAYGLFFVGPSPNLTAEAMKQQKQLIAALSITGREARADREIVEWASKMAAEAQPTTIFRAFVGLRGEASYGLDADLLRTREVLARLAQEFARLGVDAQRISVGLNSKCLDQPRG